MLFLSRIVYVLIWFILAFIYESVPKTGHPGEGLPRPLDPPETYKKMWFLILFIAVPFKKGDNYSSPL